MSPNRTDTSTPLSLSDIGAHRTCRVISLKGGHGFRSKMHELGIHGAEDLRVVINGGRGPLVVELRGTRLILGRHMAERIWVSGI